MPRPNSVKIPRTSIFRNSWKHRRPAAGRFPATGRSPRCVPLGTGHRLAAGWPIGMHPEFNAKWQMLLVKPIITISTKLYLGFSQVYVIPTKLQITFALLSASGRRHWPICWCCPDRGPGSFDVEDATTLSWSSAAVSEWVTFCYIIPNSVLDTKWMNEGIYVRPCYRSLSRGCWVSTDHTLGYTVQFLVCYRNQRMSGSSHG